MADERPTREKWLRDELHKEREIRQKAQGRIVELEIDIVRLRQELERACANITRRDDDYLTPSEL